MNSKNIKTPFLFAIFIILMSMNACSSESNKTGNDVNIGSQNHNAPSFTSNTSTVSSQVNKQYLNEQLSNRLNRIIATESREIESSDNVIAISSLLDQGADVNARNSAGQPLLIEATQNGHIKAMEILLNRGAEVNAQDDRGNTALIVAAGFSDVKMVKLLLAKGAKVNIKNGDGFTALSGSEMIGGSNDPQYLEVRRLLKKAGAK